MLNLKRVRKENDWIYADYYPENWGEYGSVSVNVNDLDDYKIEMSKTDAKKYPNYPYAVDALNAIRRMANGDKEMKDCMIMIY